MGETYNKCTYADTNNQRAWCAYNIEPNSEVPTDGLHWGDCQRKCSNPGKKY